MSKLIDRLPQKEGTETTKSNYTEIGLGNDKGSICFGHIHEKGDVTADVALFSHDGKHFMVMDGDGHRKGWTTFACPGNFQVEAGDRNKKIDTSIMINAKNGDICINAKNGKIRFEADDIEFKARGEGGSGGNIRFEAAESFIIENTKQIQLDCSNFFKLSTCETGQIIANGQLSIYGSIIKGVTDACSVKPSKNSNQNFQKKCTQGA